MSFFIIYIRIVRGFDFRPSTVRTLTDGLTNKDAMQRTVDFIDKYLK